MIKMRTIVDDFDEMEGKFKKGFEFLVNEERAFVLTRLGKAERHPDQSTPPADAGTSETDESLTSQPAGTDRYDE